MDVDDRGRAYACWREVPDYENEHETGNSVDLFFRFDFLVEPDLAIAQELIAKEALAVGAVARRAEEAFVPLFVTIWIDIDGKQVANSDLLADLERPYHRATDTNLREPRWQQVNELGMVADWSAVCQSAYASAEALLRKTTALEERIEQARQQIQSRFETVQQQLETRIAILDHPASELEALAQERSLYECLRTIVSEPRIRLDSVGAVFLSGVNPFLQANDG